MATFDRSQLNSDLSGVSGAGPAQLHQQQHQQHPGHYQFYPQLEDYPEEGHGHEGIGQD